MMGNLITRNQRGGLTIEAALLLPMMVLLIFGMIEFSLLLYNRQVITNGSREGARAGIVQAVPRLSDGEIGNVVGQYCLNRLITFGSATGPSTTVTRAGNASLSPLTVRVTYDYEFLVLGALGFDPIQLVAETVMRLE
jgi:Flp pilus assembly protein TadG